MARSALWLAGHAGWYQERWIARHVQRARGEHAAADALRLASVEPAADAWFETGGHQPPDADTVRRYLADTLDTTLDLLARPATATPRCMSTAPPCCTRTAWTEALAERAAALQLRRQPDPPPPWAAAAGAPDREPLWLGGQAAAGQRAAAASCPASNAGPMRCRCPNSRSTPRP
jgi:hypothetical protein